MIYNYYKYLKMSIESDGKLGISPSVAHENVQYCYWFTWRSNELKTFTVPLIVTKN